MLLPVLTPVKVLLKQKYEEIYKFLYNCQEVHLTSKVEWTSDKLKENVRFDGFLKLIYYICRV